MILWLWNEKKTQKICAKIEIYLRYVFVIVFYLTVALFISSHLCTYHIPVSTFHGISKKKNITEIQTCLMYLKQKMAFIYFFQGSLFTILIFIQILVVLWRIHSNVLNNKLDLLIICHLI